VIWVNTYFFLTMLAWSIFGPFLCIYAGWRLRRVA
jgi:hypothetical protein